MKFISVTRLRLRSWRYLLAFFKHAAASTQQAIAAEGNLSTQTRQQRFRVFWTITIWDSETAMRHFMRSGAHREAMPKLVEWCDEASTVHWWQETTELPSWEDIQQRMMTNGRIYPLKYPSHNHTAGVIQR